MSTPSSEAPGIAARLARELNPAGSSPVSSQIVQALWLAVVEGSLESGERLPTVRQLAVDVNVSPRAVERAYEQLEKLGVVTVRAGQGTFVSLALPPASGRDRFRELERRCRELVNQVTALGFTIDDAVDLLTELRAAERQSGMEGVE